MNNDETKKAGRILIAIGDMIEQGIVKDITPKQFHIIKMLGDEIFRSNFKSSEELEKNNKRLLELINEELSKENER